MSELSDVERRLLESAERQMLQFAENGSVAVFGRLEGIAEALEVLGLTAAQRELQALTTKHYKAMARMTAGYPRTYSPEQEST
jgi:hypothetical protein